MFVEGFLVLGTLVDIGGDSGEEDQMVCTSHVLYFREGMI